MTEAINLQSELNDKIIAKNEERTSKLEQQINKSYKYVLGDIEKKTKDSDEFYTLIASSLNLTNNKSEGIILQRQLIRDLQANKNIISKTQVASPGNDGHKLAVKMQPYTFKWVDEEEKAKLKFRANTIKGLEEKHIEFIERKMKDYKLGSEADILRCFEYLIRLGAVDGWMPLDVFEVARKCAIPINECIQVVNDLANNDAIVLAYYEIEANHRSGVSRKKSKLAVGIAFEDEEIEELKKASANGTMVSLVAADSKKKQKKKKVSSAKVRQLARNTVVKVDDAKKNEILSKIEERTHDIKLTNSVMFKNGDEPENTQTRAELEAMNSPLQNIQENVSIAPLEKNVDIYSEFARMIGVEVANKVAGFVNGQVQSVHEERDNALFEKNNAIRFKEKQAQHIANLQKTIDKLEAENAKLKGKLSKTESREEAYKDFSDEFSMNAVKQLQLLQHRLSKRAQAFAELPRYQKWDEMAEAEFTTDVANIIKELSDKIINYKPESKMPPNQR